MLRRILLASVGLLIAGAAMESKATLVALWSFDGNSTAPNSGSQSGTATFASTGTTSFQTGTTLNDPRTSPSITPSIRISASGTFTLHVSGTGLSSFMVSYAASKTGGNGDHLWSYSTDGVNFTQLSGPLQPGNAPSGFGVQTINLSTITALNGATDVYLRDTVGGNAIDFDNIQVNVVPEPVNTALACFGLGFVGLALGRKLLKREKLKS